MNSENNKKFLTKKSQNWILIINKYQYDINIMAIWLIMLKIIRKSFNNVFQYRQIMIYALSNFFIFIINRLLQNFEIN